MRTTVEFSCLGHLIENTRSHSSPSDLSSYLKPSVHFNAKSVDAVIPFQTTSMKIPDFVLNEIYVY